MVSLRDLHCHLTHCYFESDLDKVIENAEKNNVKVILTAGLNPESNRKILESIKKYKAIKACLGIHPVIYIKDKIKDTVVEEETEFIEKNKKNIVAIAEVGLDRFWHKSDKDLKKQKRLFERMIYLAERLDKPIIVHSRRAENECIEMIESSKLKKVIMHSFTGKKDLVKKISNNNWYFTIPSNVIRAKQFQDIVREVPITQLFCETDAPYLSPFRDKRNEPSFVVEAYKKIAEIKRMDFDEIVNNIYMNWQKTFQ